MVQVRALISPNLYEIPWIGSAAKLSDLFHDERLIFLAQYLWAQGQC